METCDASGQRAQARRNSRHPGDEPADERKLYERSEDHTSALSPTQVVDQIDKRRR